MALFTVGKNDEGKVQKYHRQSDLEALIHYCCDKSRYTSVYNLYPFDTDTLIDQFLYLQKCRGKGVDNRAVHYIMSFCNWEFSPNDKIQEAIEFIGWLEYALPFKEFQHIICLHDDKKSRIDIHMIINPVNIRTYNLYHCSISEYKAMGKEIAYWLFLTEHIALQPFSYIDINGRMHYGYDEVLYQNKW